jgi:hypothetical protein
MSEAEQSSKRPPPEPGESASGVTLARRLGIVALALALLLGPLWLRAWIDGGAQLREADAAAEAGDLDAQIRHLGRAARWRLPLAGHDELARARLREIGETAAEAGRVDEALVAWRELRRALLATRVVDVADSEQLEAANAAILELMVAQARGAGAPIERERWAAELAEDLEPRGRSLAAAACFAAWLLACVGFFARALDDKGRLRPRPALRWGAAVVVLLGAWILLM